MIELIIVFVIILFLSVLGGAYISYKTNPIRQYIIRKKAKKFLESKFPNVNFKISMFDVFGYYRVYKIYVYAYSKKDDSKAFGHIIMNKYGEYHHDKDNIVDRVEDWILKIKKEKL